MEAPVTWPCPACGAANAAYRRRCLDCGERRPSAAASGAELGLPPPPLALSEADAAEAARNHAAVRRYEGAQQRFRRRPLLVGLVAAAVVGCAAYGAWFYVNAQPPDPSADMEALERAALEADEVQVGYEVLDEDRSVDRRRLGLLQALQGSDAAPCGPELADAETEAVAGNVVAQLERDYGPSNRPTGVPPEVGYAVRVIATTAESPVAARAIRQLYDSDPVRACMADRGMAWATLAIDRSVVVLAGAALFHTDAELAALAALVLERLELEG